MLVGRCYEAEGAPYGPVVEMLETALEQAPTPQVFREALGEDAPELARIMPRLRRAFPDIPPPLELPPEQERAFVFSTVKTFVARTAAARPAVLVFEDLHWADASTLLLLEHLVPGLHEMPVLVIGTYRDVELDVVRPLSATLDRALRSRDTHRIPLRRLGRDDVAAVLSALAGREPLPRLVDAVYAETEGNAFFVVEVFRHLAEEGKLFGPDGRLRDDLEVDARDVPQSVRLVIGRRLERLSEPTRRVLQAAAAVGRAFGYRLLQELVDVGEDELLDSLDEAERARVVSSLPGATPRFAFAHELIRQTLLHGHSLPRRQRLHLRVADALERMHPGGADEHTAEIAFHLYEAGEAADADGTARYLVRASDLALAGAAFEDAHRHAEAALTLGREVDPALRADALSALGRALRSLGRTDEALEAWRTAIEAYADVGDAETIGRLALHSTLQLIWDARFPEALEMAQLGLVGLGDLPAPERAALLGQAGYVVGFTGDYPTGLEMCDEAVRLGRELGDDWSIGMALHMRFFLRWAHGDVAGAPPEGLEALDRLRGAGELWHVSNLVPFVQRSLFMLGRFEEAAALDEEAESLSARLGHDAALWNHMRVETDRRLITGQLQAAENGGRQSLDFGRRAGLPWICYDLGFLGVTALLRGRWDEARALAWEGTRDEPAGALRGSAGAMLLGVLCHRGERDEALALVDGEGWVLPRRRPASIGRWFSLRNAIEGLALLGETERVGELYGPALELLATGIILLAGDTLSTHTVAGIAAACAERWEEAEGHYRDAMRFDEERGFRLEEPTVRRWWAWTLLRRRGPGDAERARGLLEEAIEGYRALGMPKHEEMAAAMLRDL